MYPLHIVFEDPGGGFWVLKYFKTVWTADKVYIPVYHKKEYYHDLASALKEL